MPEPDISNRRYLVRGKFDALKQLHVAHKNLMLASWHFQKIGEKVIVSNSGVEGKIVRARWSVSKGFEVDIRVNGNDIEELTGGESDE